MKLFEGDFRESAGAVVAGCTLTIGNFDGVHLGHRALVESIVRLGQQNRLPPSVLTFSPHPAKVLGGRDIESIYPLESQLKILESLGVENLFVQTFSKDFASLTPKDFLRQYLFPKFCPKALVIGDDFGFGQSKEGGVGLLESFCSENECELFQCETLFCDNQRISSTRVRCLLKAGQIEELNQILGQPFFICGKVVEGQRLGRTLGFPTANLEVGKRLYPMHGVYRVRAKVGGVSFQGVVNIGFRPSVSRQSRLTVECHLLNFSGDLYGKELSVEFLEFIRGEVKFQSLEALKAQIHRDVDFVMNPKGERGGL